MRWISVVTCYALFTYQCEVAAICDESVLLAQRADVFSLSKLYSTKLLKRAFDRQILIYKLL